MLHILSQRPDLRPFRGRARAQVLGGVAKGNCSVWRRGDRNTLCNTLKKGCSLVDISFFSQVTSDETQGNRLKLCREKLRLILGR